VAEASTPLPNALEEEVRRLYESYGCRHIILLAHRFGERRVGQRASRVRLQGQGQLLHAIGQAFPDLLFYPLVRDTFHATRLRRTDAEAFEIVDPDDHTDIVGVELNERRHEYTPVFSLATLQVVGESSAARKPQSGFCTYFLLHDEDTLSVEAMARIQSTLLLREAPVRRSLQAVLRSIHYLEAERSVTVAKRVRPVLDPYDWMLPEAAGKVGEVLVFARSRRGHGSVSLSITAVLELVSRALHARRADV